MPVNLINQPAATRFAGTPQSVIRFGERKPDDNNEQACGDSFEAGSKPGKGQKSPLSVGQRLKNAGKGSLAAGFDRHGLWVDTLWAAGLSLAAMVMPGSQIIVVPFTYLSGFFIRAIQGAIAGYRYNPAEFKPKPEPS